MGNIMNEKLDIGAWLNEYVDLLEREGKLDEDLMKVSESYSPGALESDDEKKDLLKAFYKVPKNKAKLDELYLAYLNRDGVLHLVD